MKMLRLNRQKRNEIEFDELFEMLHNLEDFLGEDANLYDRDWNKNINAILDFQDDDGSFKLIETYRIPSDARVDFCHMPTYLCSAILMKAYLKDESAFSIKEKTALQNGLRMSCARNLKGHGYEDFQGQIKALNIFFNAGLREFMDIHHDFCPEFSSMIDEIIAKFRRMEAEGRFLGSWNESYENEIKAINEYFSQRNIFVYGTLMGGEANHRYLENASFLGTSVIEGYDMYDVGWYPAVIPGDSMIVGELYQVPIDDMSAIDLLEWEGSLYIKKCETLKDANGNSSFAFVYVYIRDVDNLERIPAWKNDYVWYVSYGSNMLEDRFMCYIEGGSYEGSRYHPPCRDTTPPLAVKAIEIPYGMYFGNNSGSWNGSGVSFLDTTEKGNALGVAYLITKEQFEHVTIRENSGRRPQKGYGWYEDIIDLGMMNGFEVKTITNENLRPYNEPSQEYWNTLFRGIRQNWPEMRDEEIEDYLNSCIR